MTTSIPAPKTLSINTLDLISVGGQTYSISNVSSADDGAGFILYTVTLAGAGLPLTGSTIVCKYTNTVVSAKAPKSVSGTQINADFWVYSGGH